MDLDLPPCTVPASSPGKVLPETVAAPQVDPWLLRAGQEDMHAPISPPMDPRLVVALPSEAIYAAIVETSRPQEIAFDGSYSKRRAAFRHLFGYAIPSKEAVAGIAAFTGSDLVCEVGAGRGLWARLLGDVGVQVDATDYAATPEGITNRALGYFGESKHTFVPVRTQFAKTAAAETPAKTLMMVWPPYKLPVASQSLANFRGDKLVYIGEGRGDSTADDKFFDILAESWVLDGEIEIPQWECVHDTVCLYRRR